MEKIGYTAFSGIFLLMEGMIETTVLHLVPAGIFMRLV